MLCRASDFVKAQAVALKLSKLHAANACQVLSNRCIWTVIALIMLQARHPCPGALHAATHSLTLEYVLLFSHSFLVSSLASDWSLKIKSNQINSIQIKSNRIKFTACLPPQQSCQICCF